MAKTVDAAIIGAGPAGLFAAFQLGLFGIGSRIFEAGERPGGQCVAFYADKPIYDIPGRRKVMAGELVAGLLDQLQPIPAEFALGRTVQSVEKRGERFLLSSEDGRCEAKLVVLASGGGALRIESPHPSRQTAIVPPPSAWGIKGEDGLAAVATSDFETSVPGLFAIGDAASYPGKLRLILSGFHEAALMAQAARRLLRPGERPILHYTTTSTALKKRIGAAE